MKKDEAKNRILKLRQLIDKYRYEYHVLDKPTVSDAVNDSLKHELQELENNGQRGDGSLLQEQIR